MQHEMTVLDLLIGCVTENKPKYLAQALRLIQSIRWFGGRTSDAKLIVCAVDDIAPVWEEEFRRYGAEVRVVERYSEKHPQSNKLRFLQQREVLEYEHVVLLDCDTIVVRDPYDEFSLAGFQAKLADAATVTLPVFEKLYVAFGIPMPGSDLATTVTGEPTIPYFNAGVLIFSSKEIRELIPVWLALNERLLENIELLEGCANFCEQASLSLALTSSGTPFHCLNNAINYPTHFEGRIPALENVDPKIIHYHWKTDTLGRIEPSGYPLADKGIEAFNERRNESRLFQQLRQPIFVVGPMRSGTTFLADKLGEFDQIAHCPFELKDIWSRDGGVPTASAKTKDHLCPQLGAQDVQAGQFEGLRLGFLKKMEDIFGNTGSGRVFLNKNPHLCNKLPFVDAIFPDARYIWIFRDMPFVVASLKALFEDVYERQQTWHYWPEPSTDTRTRCWKAFHQDTKPTKVDSEKLFPGGDIKYLAEYWLESNIAVKEFFSKVDCCFRIDYDLFVSDVKNTMAECLEFLGQDYENDRWPDFNDIKEDRNDLWISRTSLKEAVRLRTFIIQNERMINTLHNDVKLADHYLQTIDKNYDIVTQPKALTPSIKIEGLRSKAICILGMHRSGTSAIARAINIWGAYLGEPDDLMKPGPDNPEGFWERNDIVSFHDRILGQLGASWDTPLPLPDDWHLSQKMQPFREELRTLITKNFSHHSLWAWKDPRTCLLLPLWKDVLSELNIDLTCVFISRNPRDVALSLQKRNLFQLHKSYGIWLNYTLAALHELLDVPSSFISYDCLIDKGESELAKCLTKIGIDWSCADERSIEELGSFLKPSLRHSISRADELKDSPRSVVALFEIITEATENGSENSEQLSKDLSRLSMQYREFTSILGSDNSNLRSQAYQMSMEITRLQKELEDRTSWAQRLNAESREESERLALLQKAFDERTAWALSLNNDVAQRDARISSMQNEFEDRTAWALKLKEDVEQRDARIVALQCQIEQYKAEVETKEEIINSLLNSMSWRITAPLRSIHSATQKKK